MALSLLQEAYSAKQAEPSGAEGSSQADISATAPGARLAMLRRRQWEKVRQGNTRIVERMGTVDESGVALHNKMATFSNEVVRFNEQLETLPQLADTVAELRLQAERLCKDLTDVEELLTQKELALDRRRLLNAKQKHEQQLKARHLAESEHEHRRKMDQLSLALDEDMERYRSGEVLGNAICANESSDVDELSAVELDLVDGDKDTLGGFYSDDEDEGVAFGGASPYQAAAAGSSDDD